MFLFVPGQSATSRATFYKLALSRAHSVIVSSLLVAYIVH